MVKKIQDLIEKVIPIKVLLAVGISVLWNCVVYYGVRLLYGNRTFYDMTSAFDRATPVLPWTVFIYYAFFPFLVLNVLVLAKKEPKNIYGYAVADVIGKTVCMIIFLIIPTTNIRPELLGNDFASATLRFLYRQDAANNLFPSIHCLDSWLSFLMVYKAKTVSKKYKVFVGIFAIMICISTLTTKQHVLPDLISGILIAQITYYIGYNMVTKYRAKHGIIE